MTGVVLDCSVALSWFVPDEDSAASRRLRFRVTDEGAVVPMLWPIELGNAFLSATRSRRINAAQRTAALDAIEELPIEIDGETLARIWTDTLAVAERFRLSLYDACYLELAQRLRLPLATLDKELRRAANRAGVAVIG